MAVDLPARSFDLARLRPGVAPTLKISNRIHYVTLTFAEQNRLALLLSGNKPLSAN